MNKAAVGLLVIIALIVGFSGGYLLNQHKTASQLAQMQSAPANTASPAVETPSATPAEQTEDPFVGTWLETRNCGGDMSHKDQYIIQKMGQSYVVRRSYGYYRPDGALHPNMQKFPDQRFVMSNQNGVLVDNVEPSRRISVDPEGGLIVNICYGEENIHPLRISD